MTYIIEECSEGWALPVETLLRAYVEERYGYMDAAQVVAHVGKLLVAEGSIVVGGPCPSWGDELFLDALYDEFSEWSCCEIEHSDLDDNLSDVEGLFGGFFASDLGGRFTKFGFFAPLVPEGWWVTVSTEEEGHPSYFRFVSRGGVWEREDPSEVFESDLIHPDQFAEVGRGPDAAAAEFLRDIASLSEALVSRSQNDIDGTYLDNKGLLREKLGEMLALIEKVEVLTREEER